MLLPTPLSSPIRGNLLSPGTDLAQLRPDQVELVIGNARLLQRAVDPVQRQRLLRGRNLALICTSSADADAMVFEAAATDLGAHVSHLRPSLSDLGVAPVLRHTARMLGRLYQGVECQGMPADIARELGREAGIPVYDGVSAPGHPLARLATLLPDGGPPEQALRLIVQAVLMSTIG